MRSLKVYSVLFFMAFVIFIGCSSAYTGPLKEGDIVFQDLPCSQSEAIKLATHSNVTHVGIILLKGGQPYVYEAVGPVKFTSINKWIAQGDGSHYTARRLKNADKVLTPETLKKMEEVAKTFKGKAYDWTFEWSDVEMYCSELVWKIYQRSTGLEIGHLQKLKEFDFSNPVVKEQLKEKYGDNIPWNETVISPDQMLRSGLLNTVVWQ